ncbi:carboxypeptidase-like regulatory domain-containing protein [Pedobacter caeni]|nr:carboxypeptidase-like regulatory domain-containing protein [Pedobacter caeni]
MKCSFLLIAINLTFVGVLFAGNLLGQNLNQKIKLDLKNATVESSLSAIEKQSNIQINTQVSLINQLTKKVNITATEITVAEALNAVLNHTNLQFKLIEGYVVITKKPVQQRITGRVIDALSKETLPGASVKVKGSGGGTTTDSDGNFSLQTPSGEVILLVAFIGYQNKELKVNASSVNITVALVPAQTTLTEVTVQARRNTSTDVAVLNERKKSAVIQDAISSAMIEKTGSITTTQALQRVSGVTITDDKYVAIRGLGDRSVIGQLNGVRLASSNPDRSSIPLDLVPASLLDNITVYKTVTPDKPADAAAGIVELKTKSIPDKMIFDVVAQSGFNSNIGIGGNYNSFWNSEMGPFGGKIKDKNLSQDFKNLSHQYKNGLEDIQALIANSGYNPASRAEVSRINNIMQSFDPIMTTTYRKAPINQLYSATFGNSYQVFKNHRLGVILGGNYYRRTSDIYQGTLSQYSIFQGLVTGNPQIFSPRNIPNFTTPNTLRMGRSILFAENTGTEILNYGTLAGLAYRFNSRHEISFQYLGSWGAENEATNLYGTYLYSALPGTATNSTYSLKQTRRNLQTFNLQGEHKLLSSDYAPVLSYNIAKSTSYHNNPDFRFGSLVNYSPPGGATYIDRSPTAGKNGHLDYLYTDHLYALSSGYINGFGPYGIMQAEPNGRRWRTMNEDNYNYKADLSIPFPLFGHKQTFKTGFNYLNRDRTFSENVLFLPGSNFSSSKEAMLYQAQGDLDRLVSNDIIGVKVPTGSAGEGQLPLGGFLYNTLKSPNNYKGYFETKAIYGMLDLQVTDELRVAGGVRFEKTDIQSVVDTANIFLDPALTAPDAKGNRIPIVLINPNSKYKTNYMPYYSLNATYTLKENMNFRAAFNTALARPELREITNVFEFDAFQMGLVVGNKDLINQKTENIDFRWEWFPDKGEVIALSAFGKRLNNQLIKVYSLRTEGIDARFPEFPTIQFQNDPNTGYVWGLELELVKNLGKLWQPLSSFNMGFNLLLAQSEVKKTQQRLLANRIIDRYASEKSPLFEQAPYSVNTWLNFEYAKWGTSLTGTFNIVGERLIQINLTGEPDLYSRPVPMLDFVFSQKLSNRVLLKGYAKNILNPAIKTVYANPGSNGRWYGNEYINRSYKRGAEIMVGFTYNLFK